MTEERKGTVVRFVEYLGLSSEALAIAMELIEQIDMPVVFLVDHDLDKQYAIRSEHSHNEFWVFANPQEEQSEFDRLVLSQLYRAIQERRRLLRPRPLPAQIQKYRAYANKKTAAEREENYKKLMGCISSLVTTIDAEAYLKPKGIRVSSKQKQRIFLSRIEGLDEYLRMQKNGMYQWYDESEWMNTLDLSRVASFDPRYRDEVIKRLKRIKPSCNADRMVARLHALLGMIQTARQRYLVETPDVVAEWMLHEICKIMQFEDKVLLTREYAMEGRFPVSSGEDAVVYSYVPLDIPDEKSIVRTMRFANECIALFRSSSPYPSAQAFPDAHVNLIDSDTNNAYANTLNSENYISITIGLIRFLVSYCNTRNISVDEDIIRLLGIEEVERRLLKYAIFYVIAHEYAHIIRGDCMNSAVYQTDWNLFREKEHRADITAIQLITELLPYQYRPDPSQSIQMRIATFSINRQVDPRLLSAVCHWCDTALLRELS